MLCLRVRTVFWHCHTSVMCSPIGVLWTLLSAIVAGLTGFSFLQPFWFINRETLNSLGMYSYCIRDMRTKGSFSQVCGVYGGTFHFSNLPSNAWQVSCVLYGGGTMLVTLTALVAALTLCLPATCDRRVAALTGYVQTTGVVLMIAGLVIFPIGLDSKFVRHYCREARMYHGGSCQIGWSFLLAVVGTSLSIFTPFLSQYTDLPLHDPHREVSVDRKPGSPAFV